ncbi:MAG: ribosome biogenesis GTPase Der [Defluviitaleaceae bacterium]|nr:ribosome biogenesis GTPase Der [Defluviitaleaceae bacterium]
MSKPIVAVVGRPNVGKSTLFNKIAGSRLAIVEDKPGITRDRLYADAEWLNRHFTLVDTGGLDPESDMFLAKQVLNQAEIAMDTADVILFIVDGRAGVLEADYTVANMLRKVQKRVLLVVNKIDAPASQENNIYEFYSLGLGDPIPISAGQALGLGDLLDEVIALFPKSIEEDLEEEIIKVAIVGKPNVGKSSLINRILGEERVIVSDTPGTTRDVVDTYHEHQNRNYVFMDTAGIRRKSKIKENIEKYSIVRAVSAVERADVCVLLIDAEEGITEQDTKIAGIAHERGKAAIIAVNKWDKIEKDTRTMKTFSDTIDKELAYMPYAPKLFISALTGQRVNKLFSLIHTVYQNNAMRISTGILNDVIIEATAIHQPPTDKGKALRIYYATQVSVKPPTFILFVNDSKLMHFSYKRFLENKLRDAFGFAGTPIHFIVREREN